MSTWPSVGMKVEPAKVKHGPDRPGTLCECGAHAFASITRGFVTFVSPEDIGVFDRKWSVNLTRGHSAAVRILHPERRPQLLHRLILSAPDGASVDHINRDSLDNRRCNLRICDQAQNSWNSKAHRDKKDNLPKGVVAKRSKFSASIMVRGELHRLGVYETKELAGEAYASAARKYHGEFARLE